MTIFRDSEKKELDMSIFGVHPERANLFYSVYKFG
jgi:hypothetical protein